MGPYATRYLSQIAERARVKVSCCSFSAQAAKGGNGHRRTDSCIEALAPIRKGGSSAKTDRAFLAQQESLAPYKSSPARGELRRRVLNTHRFKDQTGQERGTPKVTLFMTKPDFMTVTMTKRSVPYASFSL